MLLVFAVITGQHSHNPKPSGNQNRDVPDRIQRERLPPLRRGRNCRFRAAILQFWVLSPHAELDASPPQDYTLLAMLRLPLPL